MDLCLIAATSAWLDPDRWIAVMGAVVGLGLVIFVHELGHFLVAKACGVKCEKFYVGFDVPIKIGPIALPRTLFKRTWGESLIRHFGLGLVQFLITAAGIIVFGVLAVLIGPMSPTALIGIIALGVIYVIMVSLVFMAAHQIFNTALYCYAEGGSIPQGYSQDVMAGAFRTKG